jgi:Zn-dependent protease
MPQLSHSSREFRNTQTAFRFVLRIVILCVFATLGGIGFARGLVALSWMSSIMCVVVGIVRRERVFDSALTHWDEAAAYGLLCSLVSVLVQTPAP